MVILHLSYIQCYRGYNIPYCFNFHKPVIRCQIVFIYKTRVKAYFNEVVQKISLSTIRKIVRQSILKADMCVIGFIWSYCNQTHSDSIDTTSFFEQNFLYNCHSMIESLSSNKWFIKYQIYCKVKIYILKYMK
jgi:hypothetical protein